MYEHSNNEFGVTIIQFSKVESMVMKSIVWRPVEHRSGGGTDILKTNKKKYNEQQTRVHWTWAIML